MLNSTHKTQPILPASRSHKRGADLFPEFDIELELPRNLPITLSADEELQVSALVSNYQNTPNFNPEASVPPTGRSRLIQATFDGDFLEFVALIRMGAQLNRSSCSHTLSVQGIIDKNWTPLLMASYRGHLRMVDLLIKFGVNVNHQSYFGHTALTLAKEYSRNQQVIAILREDGADEDLHRKSTAEIVRDHRHSTLNLYDPSRAFALNDEKSEEPGPAPETDTSFGMTEQEENEAIQATVMRHQENRNFAVEKRVSSRSLLMHAIFERNFIEFYALLKLGADINGLSRGGLKNHEHWTPLMMASSKGSLRMVEELVKRGANVNHQSHSGLTALMLAVRNNYTEVKQFLLTHGATLQPNTAAVGAGVFFSPQLNPHLRPAKRKLAEAAELLIGLNNAQGATPVDSPHAKYY